MPVRAARIVIWPVNTGSHDPETLHKKVNCSKCAKKPILIVGRRIVNGATQVFRAIVRETRTSDDCRLARVLAK